MDTLEHEAVACETPTVEEQETTGSVAEILDNGQIIHEAAALREIYPEFDLEEQMQNPLFRGLLKGEISLNLRQIYELCHGGEIAKQKVEAAVAEAVRDAVDRAVSDAVVKAVTETEARVLSGIRARGQRPRESGLHAAQGVRTHPAVGRLTKADREKLARRAFRGETIQF